MILSLVDMGKEETKEKIEKFFKGRHESEEVRKIRKLAMANQIKLGEKRKLFCKRCNSMELKVLGVKRGIKRVMCRKCDSISRWKVR